MNDVIMRQFYIITILCAVCACSCGQRQAEMLARNDAEYKAKCDSLDQAVSGWIIWHNDAVAKSYGVPRVKLMNELEAHPEREHELRPILDSLNHCFDSLMTISDAMYNEIEAERSDLCEEYKLISTVGFEDFFRQRSEYTMEELEAIYKSVPRILKRTGVGKAMHSLLYGPKVLPGDKIKTFDCFDRDGKDFDWRIIDGRKTVIVVDGLDCMTHGMDDSAPIRYFDSLKNEYGEDFVLIVYFNNQNPDGLKELSDYFGLTDYIVIGDGLEFATPFQLMYDTCVTPSYVLINPDGTLDSVVIDTEHVEAFLETHE